MTVRQTLAGYAVLGAIAAAFSTATLAQDDQGAALEEVVVTGSYLYTGVDSPSPVTVFSGEDIIEFAPPDLATFFFDNVPQNYTSDNIAQTDAEGMARTRSIRNASINLRGLGDENSLAVLNGRRTIGYPVPDGTGWNRVDINSMVPRIALRNIEVLLDGGSAIFGSDPVAGVANFVTNNQFRGFDLTLDSRTLQDATDAKNMTLGVLFGAGDDTTSIIAAIEFHQEDIVRRREIDTSFADPDVTPETGTGLERYPGLVYGNGQMGGMAVSWIDPLCGQGNFDPIFDGIPAWEDDMGTTTGPDATADDELRPVEPGDGNTVIDCTRSVNNDQGFQLVNNEVAQIITFVRAEHNFSDSLRANAELNYSRQTFDDVEMWGDNNGVNWTPQNQASLGYALPVDHPGLVHAQGLDPTFGAGGMGPPPPVYALSETLPFASELAAFNTNELFRAAFGVEGDFSNNWSWLVDSSVAYSDVENGVRDPLTALYPLALAGMGGANCDPAAAAGEGECYYYNPFMSSALPDASSLQAGVGPGLSQTGLANNPEMLEWLIPNRIERFFGEFFSLDFRITGQFGELPGGPIGAAFGVAYREDSIERDADASSNAGTTAAIGIVNDFKGKQAIDSQYFEIALPVHEDVNVQIAGRNESYDGGFSEFSPKIAALWTPTDRLTIRGSIGTSFKGPSISQTAAATTFQGGGPTFTNFDGMSYGMMGMFNASFTTNPAPDLLPQTSDNLSVGFDFIATDNISFGASYVAIDFKDRIVAPTANVVSQNLSCHPRNPDGSPVVVGGNLLWLSVADGGCIVPIDPASPLTADNIGLIVSAPENLGFLNTEFLDLRANMGWDTGIGQLTFSPNVSIVLTYEFPLPDGTDAPGLCPDGLCSSVARNIGMGFSNGINNIPRWQGNFPVTLTRGAHRFRLNTSYRDSLNSEVDDLDPALAATQNFVHEEGQWLVDLQWNWQITPGTSIGLASRNLFATEPPTQQAARFNRRLREYTLTFRHSFDN